MHRVLALLLPLAVLAVFCLPGVLSVTQIHPVDADASKPLFGYRVVKEELADAASVGVDTLYLSRVEASTPYGEQYQDVTCMLDRRHPAVFRIVCNHPVRGDSNDGNDDVIDIVDPAAFAAAAAQGPDDVAYSVEWDREPFALRVRRKSDGFMLLDTTPRHRFNGLLYAKQFVQVSFARSKGSSITGFGERGSASHELADGADLMLFNIGRGPVHEDLNSYGSHPVMMEHCGNGTARGVFWPSLLPLHVGVHTQHIELSAIGGIVDLYVMAGPSPDDVWKQYHGLVGPIPLPALWALGWHQSRWGYASADELRHVEANYTLYDLPLDVVWSDIDYMDGAKDFTLGPDFPLAKMQAMTKEWRSRGRRWVPIVDVGIKIEPGYPAFDQGVRDNVFIMNPEGTMPIIGKVYPGYSYFPDWWHPNATAFWQDGLASVLGFGAAGIWIDKNEPANDCRAQCDILPSEDRGRSGNAHSSNNGAADDAMNLHDPPYWPSTTPIEVATLNMAARHHVAVHYSLHQVYGLMEARVTSRALKHLRPDERPFILSRSTFPSAGRVAHHWLGDNRSTWLSLRHSVTGVLNFQFFGIPLVGPDTCGFSGDVTPELCMRWMQLASWYPFARNHNHKHAQRQEPWELGRDVVAATRVALRRRYSMLPFLYTQFARVSQEGGGVWRPLANQYPVDSHARHVSDQFLVGDAIMVAPVLEPGQQGRCVYFPADRWYLFDQGALVPCAAQSVCWLDALVDQLLPVFQRAGTVVPTQQAATTTERVHASPVNLSVALPAPRFSAVRSESLLYWDDLVTPTPDDAASVWTVFNLTQRCSKRDVRAGLDHGSASVLVCETTLRFAARPRPQPHPHVFGDARLSGLRFLGASGRVDMASVQFNGKRVSAAHHDATSEVLAVDLSVYAPRLDPPSTHASTLVFTRQVVLSQSTASAQLRCPRCGHGEAR